MLFPDIPENAVLRVGEDNGRMAVTGAEFPAATVVLNSLGVSITQPGEYPGGETFCAFPSGCVVDGLRLSFWGASGTGRMLAEWRVNNAWQTAPQLGFTQPRGWLPPANPQETKWNGDLAQLANETRFNGTFFEIKYMRSGAVFLVK